MQIRKMALALPLAFGVACSTSHANRTARTEGTAGSTATAQTGTYGTPGSSTAAGSSDIKGHDSDKVLMGKVAEVSSSSLSIQSDMGDSRTLQVVPETIVTVDGREGHISDIQQGQEVRASFNEQDGKQVAVRVEAGRPAGDMGGHMGSDTSTPAAPGTGSGTTGTGTGTPTDMGAPGSSPSGSSSTSDTGTSSGSTGTSGTGTGGGYDTSGTR
ncbi:hypothetical protein [Anaeromyxobacter terrae]|uniref:hypothetical protein n=1 Tax=Anaeromyxobacter terrae TaxID=2925406 RepID=UPI001F55ECF7|nr:hypothetical protein [Anaeromyxobacter sp. SG22]